MSHIDRIKRKATSWKSLFKSNMDPYVQFQIATNLKYPKMDQFKGSFFGDLDINLVFWLVLGMVFMENRKKLGLKRLGLKNSLSVNAIKVNY